MKTSIKSLIALTIITLVLTASTTSTFAAVDQKETVLTEVKKVSSINVSGNVELILVQSNDESVKVYDDYYAKNALVQQKNGELRISSYGKETLTVVVYLSNLTSLSASDRASVRTVGTFHLLSLDVNLKNNATANLATKSITLSSTVADDSNLTLSGSTEQYSSLMSNFAKVNMTAFAAENTSIESKQVTSPKAIKLSQVIDAE